MPHRLYRTPWWALTGLGLLALQGCAAVAVPSAAEGALCAAGDAPRITLIGHRGASALRPEHTLAAYRQAIADGADFIEPDLAITRDGVLVARHENAIAILNADGSVKEATTDVADRPEFAVRRTTKTIDGERITGWFTEDFTLAELKTLRARERIPQVRPANVRYDGQFEIPTLQEVIDLARAETARTGRSIGIYPETKHPTYFASIGLPLEPPLLALLQAQGWTDARAPVIVQSFEPGSLRMVAAHSGVRRVQLMAGAGRPYDFVVRGDARRFADLATPAGLAEIATYAHGIGASKGMVLPVQGGALQPPTPLVAQAHAAGLFVHVWTLRPENAFLPPALRAAPQADPAVRGDAGAEIAAFVRSGVEGLFADDPATVRTALACAHRR